MVLVEWSAWAGRSRVLRATHTDHKKNWPYTMLCFPFLLLLVKSQAKHIQRLEKTDRSSSERKWILVKFTWTILVLAHEIFVQKFRNTKLTWRCSKFELEHPQRQTEILTSAILANISYRFVWQKHEEQNQCLTLAWKHWLLAIDPWSDIVENARKSGTWQWASGHIRSRSEECIWRVLGG